MLDQWHESVLGFNVTELLDAWPISQPKPVSVLQAGWRALNSSSMTDKVILTLFAFLHHKEGKLPISLYQEEQKYEINSLEHPSRPKNVQVLAPRDMPKRNAHSKKNALIHSLAHIESYAIDLSWDILIRFFDDIHGDSNVKERFATDWLRIAADEARHFSIWENRLREMDSFYGAYPVHDALWESASLTKDSVLERLAIVHMVHEARGLDVAPQTLQKLKKSEDYRSSELLNEIYVDEISHVATAVNWFKSLLGDDTEEDIIISKFHDIVKSKFRGSLKPPFNEVARHEAGFTSKWYEGIESGVAQGEKPES